MVEETDLKLGDGRTLHIYDADAPEAGARLTVFWQHGTPNTGEPPEPLFPAAAERGIRWVSHDRPGYGTSTPQPGRDVAAVAGDVAAIADALGIETFAVMGHSGGGPHALAGDWAWLGRIAGLVMSAGPDGMIDDELAYVRPWGFSPGQVSAPVLLFNGGQDRMVPSGHGEWLARRCPGAEVWRRPDDGHVSVLESCAVPALDWLVAHAS